MLRINIGFRLPREIEQEALEIVATLPKTKEYFFTVDNITVLPHVSLYAPVVKEENLNPLLNSIEHMTLYLSSTYLTVKEISQGQGYIGVEFGLTPDIKEMQNKVIDAVLSFAETKLLEKYADGADYHMTLSPGALQSLEKYGSVGIINFHPHLTLTRVTNDIDAQVLKRKVVWSKPRFLVSKIGVFAMGDHGVCQELIAEFPLKSP